MKCFECGEEINEGDEGYKWELCPECFNKALEGGELDVSLDNMVSVAKSMLSMRAHGVKFDDNKVIVSAELFKKLFGTDGKNITKSMAWSSYSPLGDSGFHVEARTKYNGITFCARFGYGAEDINI